MLKCLRHFLMQPSSVGSSIAGGGYQLCGEGGGSRSREGRSRVELSKLKIEFPRLYQ